MGSVGSACSEKPSSRPEGNPFAQACIQQLAAILSYDRDGLIYNGEPDWDAMRIDYALKQHEQWYVGDGTYGDGPYYHSDYYNSFVIQPMLLDIVKVMGKEEADWGASYPQIEARAARHAVIQDD